MSDLIVFSHLRWSFVYQRPQHLLSRLAVDRRVYFIEEPVPGSSLCWETESVAPNVVSCRLHVPTDGTGFSAENVAWLESALPTLLNTLDLTNYVVWFYTPMAFPLLKHLEPLAVVYDCMDELSKFLHAPVELLDYETRLMEQADLVFTGGPSLYRAKKDRHPQVYCFSSSVDAAHFAHASYPDTETPPDQDSIAHPRLGYFGVIDERIDLELLAEVATARPNWQFVMVGPVVKIDPATLPVRPNIHFLGGKKYEQLPAYLAGWDVCLMPFARNESTEFISPTKTLEYMAADKPIVSTPITDVIEPYAEIVYFGHTPSTFLEACERALGETDTIRDERVHKMRLVLQQTSWDKTASAISDLIDQTVQAKGWELVEVDEEFFESDVETGDLINKVKVAIIGAGPTGLSAAYHLGEESLLIEKNQTVGGLCRSVEIDGYTFDYAGHIMFSNDPYVHEMYEILLGENVHWQDREAWVFSHGVYTRYPFQGSLYGLPPECIKECLMGAIEARYGSLTTVPSDAGKPVEKATAGNGSTNEKTNGNGNGHADGNGNGSGHAKNQGNGHAKQGDRVHDGKLANGNGRHSSRLKDPCTVTGDVKDCCGDGVMESTATLVADSNRSDKSRESAASENFEQFIYRVWGAGIARHFAIPYNRKLWAVPLTEMETSWLGGRVPLPDLEQMIIGALSPVGKPMGPNARFGYPLRGGFQALMNGFLPHLGGTVWTDSQIVGFSPSRHELTMSDGRCVEYETLISTIPLPVLIRMAGEEVPARVREAASRLRYVSVRCVNLGIARPALTEKHWIYYPESTVFHRVFVQGNASPHCNPPGGFGLTCEITYHNEYKPLPCDGDELIQRCIRECREVGLFNDEDEVQVKMQVDIPHAYVVYDHERAANVATIRQWLLDYDVILAGRYSEWEYYNSDHAFLAGEKAAEEAVRILTGRRVANPVV